MIKGCVVGHVQYTRAIGEIEKEVAKFVGGERTERRHSALVDVCAFRLDVGVEDASLDRGEVRRGEQLLGEALATFDESITAEQQPLCDVDSRFGVPD